ncbi:MAG: Flp pilus assembly complex ATPase component TadA [Gammaproteobacteria bacterium]|nr:GAF domain-containing protein [Rhodocyclaceae bacterium]MBU3908257.1 Flp pilus assembly complex ATPase component TadA [Gammaproteobacteria bacterium]MBU3990527.1 Flp pilus assembly complex ATPase component TadA [Gammaproteobacteria bacterium]MBU4003106.1 Flp pilus assembly complex ATPase component TadA [Gammaproteobacteria bacterium]MBU4019948.1 Flp pilus assembly complex ATPase component TadA [Gammaproteobacteria bacterium]
MSAALNPGSIGQGGGDPVSAGDLGSRLAFFKNLQAVTNKIHATANIDEIMLELSQDVCALFNADRLTVYSLSDDKASIISKVKTGLNSFRDLKLPIADQSIAGYVALAKIIINIRDVYDDAELRAINPDMHFLQEVDKRTGYRTKQMLVAPIIDIQTNDLLGVVQIINNKTGVPFSAVAEEGVKGLCETLAIAFNQRSKPAQTIKTKYDHLVLDAVVAAQEMELATRSARRKNIDVEEALIAEFQVKLTAIGAALAKFFGVPYEPYKPDRIKPLDLMKNLRREYVEQNLWLPVDETPEGIVILCMDPEQVKSSRIVNNIFARSKIAYRVTTNREFKQTVDQFFGGGGFTDDTNVGDLLSAMDEGEIEIESGDDISAAADNELVKLVNKVIIDAYQQGASDIHIEPGMGKDRVLIRLRKDGSLSKYIEIPASFRQAIVARIKIMCDLDISEKRRPQDGKIKFKKFGPLDIELRVATLPTAGSVEDVVMRILAAGEPIPMEKLGLLPHNLERLKGAVSKPYGLFFVCGPTGSGKTTTLHSVLKSLNTIGTKIWTAEDPVEITQKGLRQVQINKKAGLDFPVIMKAFLRADPDIIMVGEMRDAETTKIGIEASLTGHLVFATLHTNSAPESIVRLLDMGMDPFNFSDALLGILAQRLAKRLCKCKEAYTASAEEMQHFLAEYCEELASTETFKRDGKAAFDAVYQEWVKKYANDKGQFTLYRPKENGECDTCGGSGYKGRMGLHELMIGTDAVKKLVQEHSRVALLVAQALEDGMRTLKQDGMEKVLQGMTDMKQVRAVCIK